MKKNFKLADGILINSEFAEDGTIELCVAITGEWRSRDLIVNETHLSEMVSNFNAEGRELLFDFDHKCLWDTSLAAGWGKSMELREGALYVKMLPTEAGRKAIENREYRYLSPVYEHWRVARKTGEIKKDWRLHSVAFTNTPFLTELPAIKNTESYGGNQMDELLKLLGATSEDEALTKVKAMTAELLDCMNALSEAKQKLNAQDVDMAIANKKLMPGQKALATKLINTDRALFDELIAASEGTTKVLTTEVPIHQDAPSGSDLDKVTSFSELLANEQLSVRMETENPKKFDELYEAHMKRGEQCS